MASNDVSADADTMTQFWKEWADNSDYLMFGVSDLILRQEQLVQNVLAKRPRGDDRKHAGAFRDPPLADAGSVRDVAVVWDLEDGKVRLGGTTLGTATCLETGGASLQVAKVAQREASALTGE